MKKILMILGLMGVIVTGNAQNNSAPYADDLVIDVAGNGPVNIVLNGEDDQGDALYFPVVQRPLHGDLGGGVEALVSGQIEDVEAGPASALYWMFDQDATPFDGIGTSVYAYTNLDWNSDGHGSGGCDGTGLVTSSDVFAENLDMVDGVDGLEVFLDDLVIQSQEHINTEDPANAWTTLGEAGEIRVYSNGMGDIKEDGLVKLGVTDLSLWLKIYYPDPVGAGGAAGYASGFGVGRIDLATSDPAWVAAFDPLGTGWVEVAFESFSQTVQGCYGAYDIVGMSIQQIAQENLNYTPDADFVGEDYFSYVLFDGEFFSDEVQVTLNIDANPPPLEGSGTEFDPFQISSLEDLEWLSNHEEHWDKFFRQTDDIDASATVNWNGGAGFSPIGNSVTRFTGSYAGEGHSISGLTINRGDESHQGVFGYTDEATLTNISILDGDIQGADYSGALIGYNYSSHVSLAHSSGSVSGQNMVGGLIGYNYGNVDSSSSSCQIEGSQDVGGLMGYSEGAVLVQNCFSSGSVEGVDRVGGFIGRLNFSPAAIENSYSRAQVSRVEGASEKIGGFAGSVGTACSIGNSYSTGPISYLDLENPLNKGFVGYDDFGAFSNNFWDTDSSQQAEGLGAEGMSTVQMKKIFTYTLASWDFEIEDYNGLDNDWDMDQVNDLVNNGYPFLSWENGELIALEAGAEPVAEDLEIYTGIDESIDILLAGTDADNQELTFVLWDWATTGDLELTDSTVSYTSSLGFEGEDSFMYQAYDGLFYSNVATVTIVVAQPNLAPILDVIGDQTTNEDTAAVIELSAVDGEDDQLTFSAVSSVEQIVVDVTGSTLTLALLENWYGEGQITVTVTDDGPGELTDSEVFILTVLPVNDAPNSFALLEPVNELNVIDSMLTFGWEVAADIDDEDIYYLLNIQAEDFALSIDVGLEASHTLSVLDFPRTIQLDWYIEAHDSTDVTISMIRSFTVDPSVGHVNTRPIAQDLGWVISEDSTAVLTLLGEDQDGDSLSYNLLAIPEHGEFELVANGLAYTPHLNYYGGDNLSYIVSDGEASDTGYVAIDIQSVNDAPEAFVLLSPEDEATVLDTTLTLEWEAATDVDGDELTYRVFMTSSLLDVIFQAGMNLSHTISTLDLPRDEMIAWRVEVSDSIEVISSNTLHFSVDGTVGLEDVDETPKTWVLQQNYPNPFNPSTTIRYSVPHASHIRLVVYDVSGREIVRLVDGLKSAGQYAKNWNGLDANGSAISTGMYIYKLEAENFQKIHKMLYLK